jgi:dTDP-glucose 4,6-dehydratase
LRKLTNILVSGGAGFIGVNFIHFLFREESERPVPPFEGRIINLDALTYAGNRMSLEDIEARYGLTALGSHARYIFEQGDISDRAFVEKIFQKYAIDTVVHFAAESHVDRSIIQPEAFVKTNVMGTFVLLDLARNYWKDSEGRLFHHISSDEVYGSLGETGYFSETTPYDPHSPYSASKAASDHLVMAYYHTYGLPVTLSNCSNNYGPYQFPEKYIPLMILNMLEGKPLPVYGDGRNIRDWVYVDDHTRGVMTILQNGVEGEKYNIGGDIEQENISILHMLIDIVTKKAGLDTGKVYDTITYVKDRPGHDRRYAIDCSKIKRDLGWEQTLSFEEGLARTVDWYLANTEWIDHIRKGEYKNWIETNYERR